MSKSQDVSFFETIESGKVQKPLFMILYTRPSVGKTDFGASFPKPLFFDFEESTHALDVKRKRPRSFDEHMSDLHEIFTADKITIFESLIYDTMDEWERLIHAQIAEDKKKNSIDEIGWQKGYDLAINYWAKWLSLCRDIRDKHKIHFCFLAHSKEATKPDLFTGLSYSRFSMALHYKASDYLFGQVEMVLFAKKEVILTSKEERVFAKDTEERIMCSRLSALYDAKNRIGLPATFKMPSRGGFKIIYQAYLRALDETAESVHKECLDEAAEIKDQALKDQMIKYVDENKHNLALMRIVRDKIKKAREDKK